MIDPLSPPITASTAALRATAERLESAFLAEMLGHAGMGDAPDSFGGGAGEAQFASFLRHAQADALVKAGGVGLAEQILRSLIARGAAANPKEPAA